MLTRAGSRAKFEDLQQRMGDASDRLIPVEGDLREPMLGLDEATISDLKGNIGHFCHFAAIYDIGASAESQIATNIDGTRNAVQLAQAVEAGCFEHVSSIAAGGLYKGTFREDMFEEAENLEHPYFATKHDSEGNVGGKTVLITGASSGIGKVSALRLAEAGGHVLLVARSAEKLEETAAEIAELGGMATIYKADVSNLEDCDRLVAEVLENHGFVDILINNAGRSIRRSLELSYDRFHDFERTMQINYFGAIRLTLGLLPSMSERKQGQVINMSSISALTPSPRFSAYVASKSALDAWTRAAAVEYSDRNVRFTTINMPLVRTPMIEATSVYDSMPVLSPDEAGDMVVEAVIKKPKRIATPMGVYLQVMTAVAPRFSEVVMNIVFRMFNDSAAARGEKQIGKVEASNEQVALASLMKGVHF